MYDASYFTVAKATLMGNMNMRLQPDFGIAARTLTTFAYMPMSWLAGSNIKAHEIKNITGLTMNRWTHNLLYR